MPCSSPSVGLVFPAFTTVLDEVSRLPPEYPGWMLERQGEHRARQLAEADRRAHARGMAG